MSSLIASALITGFVLLLISLKRVLFFKKIFDVLPIPFWCYLLPMILQTLGFLPPNKSPYIRLTDTLFPFALALLLLGIEVKAISKIGLKALIAMITGTLGIMLASPLLFLIIFRSYLPDEAWKGVGALAATWTGGSFNMISIRSILNVPDSIFAPLVVVDAVIAYSWMALLISMRNFETKFGIDSKADLKNYSEAKPDPRPRLNLNLIFKATAIAFVLSFLCTFAAKGLPTGSFIASKNAWAVLLVSFVSIALSCIPSIRKISQNGHGLGHICLYVVLASLGAQVKLSAIIQTPAWLLFGLTLVLTHGLILMLAGRIFRIPLGLLATASQANIGGVVSAPMVGAVYHESLVPAGLIMAITANAFGTYVGLAAAWVAKIISGG